MSPKGTERRFLYVRFPRTPKSSTKSKYKKYHGQRNHIGTDDGKYKHPVEIAHAKVVAQNAGKAKQMTTLISPQNPLMYS